MEFKEKLTLIYQNLDIPSLIPELEPIDKGKYFRLICPFCHKKEAYLKKSSLYINCNRLNKCANHISLWEYLKHSRGLSDKEVYQLLNQHCSIDIDDYIPSFNYDKPPNIVKVRIIKKPLFLIKKLYFKKNLKLLISSFNSLNLKAKFQTIISYI
jgi:hypothetical protein